MHKREIYKTQTLDVAIQGGKAKYSLHNEDATNISGQHIVDIVIRPSDDNDERRGKNDAKLVSEKALKTAYITLGTSNKNDVMEYPAEFLFYRPSVCCEKEFMNYNCGINASKSSIEFRHEDTATLLAGEVGKVVQFIIYYK